MKTLLKIVFITLTLFSFSTWISYAAANEYLDNYNTTGTDRTWGSHLETLNNTGTDFQVGEAWQKWIFNILVRIALDVKNLFFILAWLFFLILVLRLIFSDKSEEAASNFKNWVIWISTWVVVMQIAYVFMNTLFDEMIDEMLADDLYSNIMEPMTNFLITSTSFFFIIFMIYSFYLLVTANWNEEQAKSWKMSVLYAAMWFILIKISHTLVSNIYWVTAEQLWSDVCTTNCTIGWFPKIVVDIINWMNSFVLIIVVVMIVYAGFSVLVSAWDEEKLKKAKASIIYIVIWLFILVSSYMILTFFIDPEITF